jgi:hypothetical protein
MNKYSQLPFMNLLLQELMANNEERQGQTTSKESDEVRCELIPVVDGERQILQ